MELEGIDLGAEIRDLDLALQQKIEIARAMFRNPRILLLDEPTSTLSGPDVEWLGRIIAESKQRGITTIFISHRLREVRTFCSALTILRNGQHIATAPVDSLADEEVIRMIIGRSLAHAFPPRPKDPGRFGPEVVGARSLSAGDRLKEASFSLRRGEILGIAGLQGRGQLELFLACFGMIETTGGKLAVDGRPVVLTSPVDAVRSDIGISLLPEDRKTEALFLKLSGKHNLSLPVIGRFSVRVARDEFIVYVLANACYGLAGVFISAQTGAGDPLVGNPMLLQVFAAIVVGGSRLGGVLLLTALQTLLAGTTLPYATRAILFGLVILSAVIVLRERNN